MGYRRLASWLSLLLLLGMLVGTAAAGSVTILYDGGGATAIGTSTGVVLITPDTYGSCSATTDVLKTTGVGSRELRGQVMVEYVTGDGRVLVPNGYYAISQVGDLNLTVAYPPIANWLSNEIHVDIQLELYQNGYKVASLGGYQLGVAPGNDWDVYCLDRTPPPPPPTGGQGCTPGYWKQSQHVDSWPAPYVPTTTFYTAFGVGSKTITLDQALGLGGGGEKSLMRHAAAALLNASSPGVSFAFTAEQVKNIVKQAYASGNFELAKDQLAIENETGCPLN
jgi:hypothetical protein